jgi:septum formation protein
MPRPAAHDAVYRPSLARENSPVTLLLASSSPRRAELLRSAGVDFTVLPVQCDETWHEGEAPVAYCRRVARAKVEAAATSKPTSLIVAADTVVWISPDERPMGKPRDRAHALEQLRRLTSGEPHFVTTGYALHDGTVDPAQIHVYDETTRIWMRKLSEEELQAHIDTEQWHDKAGGYGIQADAAALVTRIKGSYTNVVGLPMAQLIEALHQIRSPEEGG